MILEVIQWIGITIYDVGFYSTLDKVIENVGASTTYNFEFKFNSNSIEHNVRFLLVNEDGRLYTYSETIDFPLHNDTRILLDAENLFNKADLVSVEWYLKHADVNEDVRLRGTKVYYQSEWPSVRDIFVTARTRDGEKLEKKLYALFYWKNGSPLEKIGFQAIVPKVFPPLRLVAVKQIMELAKQMGYDMMSHILTWHYSWPDENGNFYLKSIPADDGRVNPPEGWNLSDEGLRQLFGVAKELGLDITVQLLQFPYSNDAELNRAYFAHGLTPDGRCFKCEEGFLYDDGHGYWNMLMHYKDLFTELGVDVVTFGAEVEGYELDYHPNVRDFF